jgi:hypothetical protein
MESYKIMTNREKLELNLAYVITNLIYRNLFKYTDLQSANNPPTTWQAPKDLQSLTTLLNF